MDYELTPDTFLFDEHNYCSLSFAETDLGFYILGDVFLKNYYQIYDAENMQVGLVPSVTSNATITSNLPDWDIGLIAFLAFEFFSLSNWLASIKRD